MLSWETEAFYLLSLGELISSELYSFSAVCYDCLASPGNN